MLGAMNLATIAHSVKVSTLILQSNKIVKPCGRAVQAIRSAVTQRNAL
jgi:hypothetical protein